MTVLGVEPTEDARRACAFYSDVSNLFGKIRASFKC